MSAKISNDLSVQTLNDQTASQDLSFVSLSARYQRVRERSMQICEPLIIEDYGVQPMDDASPPKWHLAHTSWFFETFLLKPHYAQYKPFNAAYEYLFNSYYNGVGAQFSRPRRGHLSRPSVAEIENYRAHVDLHMTKFLQQECEGGRSDLLFSVVLGLNHEQQHQELMLTDLKYNFGNNPLYPIYREDSKEVQVTTTSIALKFDNIDGGLVAIGHDAPTAEAFVFDNECPRHQTFVGDFKIAQRLITNGEYLEFIQDGGYTNSQLWMSDAWGLIGSENGIRQPLYWIEKEEGWYEYTLSGLKPLNLSNPVVHVSGYEADAFARWAGARLPTEAEWELAAGDLAAGDSAADAAAAGAPAASNPSPNFYESGLLHPQAATTPSNTQFYGDAWEWTSSSYGPYPGFAPFPGQLGEYNGKFMANQLVLRGGSCATSADHIRRSYRNFFYPKDRWQFSGIRLAKN